MTQATTTLTRTDVVYELPRDRDGMTFVRKLLDRHKGTALIVVDTMVRFMFQVKATGGNSRDAFKQHYAQADMMNAIYRETGCSVLSSGHARKFAKLEDGIEAVNETLGGAAAVDTLWMLGRHPLHKARWAVHIEGRAVPMVTREASRDFALFGWQIGAEFDAYDEEATQGPGAGRPRLLRLQILQQIAIRPNKSATLADLRAALPDKEYGNIKQACADMCRGSEPDLVRIGDGEYGLTSEWGVLGLKASSP